MLNMDEYISQGTKKKRLHQFWGAIDIRDRIYSTNEVKDIVDFL